MLFLISFLDVNMLICVTYQQYLCINFLSALLSHSNHNNRFAYSADQDEFDSFVGSPKAIGQLEAGTYPILEDFPPESDEEVSYKLLNS
jgi:hypothetical protein